MAAYSGCGEGDGGIGHGKRRSRGPRWRELAGTFDTVGKARTVGQLVQASIDIETALVKAGFDLNQ